LIFWLTVVALFSAVIPCVMFCVNLSYYREPAAATGKLLPAVSVLIPARNEAHGIGDAVRAILASRDVQFEVVVMDDSSTDGTDAVVLELASRDSRVRLERAPTLPAGWNGKQHACWALANVASNPVLCFVDADVRLGPECLARMIGFLEQGDNGLVSGFPQQLTGTTLEWMLLPLIHFVLLGFLPIARMRMGRDPAFAAGCGQLMMVRREKYFACGGHTGIKLTMHDGLRLPKLFREHGFRTDLADITRHATCRMYTSAAQVWSGLAKNATEGLATPGRIVPISVLLVMGQVFGFGMLVRTAFWYGSRLDFVIGMTRTDVLIAVLLLLTVVAAWLPRWLGVVRFRQDWRGALLHPLGILLLLSVQWYSLLRKLMGGRVSWKDRAYTGD